MKNILSKLNVATIASVILFSCKSAPESTEEVVKDPVSIEKDIKVDLVVNDFTSPLDMSTQLAKAGLNYNGGVMNNPSKAGSYTTKYKQAMNLGVYISDLGYATANNKNQEAASYLKAVQDLATAMGIGQAFDKELMTRYEKNVGKKDSLMMIINSGFKKADQFLKSDSRVEVAALIFAGGWIESAYISTQIIGDAPRDEKNDVIFKKIGEQKYGLDNLITLLEEYKKNADHAQLLEKLKELKTTYDQIAASDSITPAQVAVIREKIASLRADIVS